MARNGSRRTPRFVELIGEERLGSILRGFSKATGAVVTVLDETGENIEIGKSRERIRGRPLCEKLIQKKCGRLPRCKERDRRAVLRARRTRDPYLFQCPDSGLWEFCVAIRALGRGEGDKIIGYLYGGQVADAEKKADGKFYPAKARRLGANEAEFMRLLEQNVVCSEEQVRAYANLLGMLANDLSATAQEQEREKAFYAASRAISAGPTLNLPDVLEQILSEIDNILKPDETTVWLEDRADPNHLIAGHTHRGLPEYMPRGKKPFFAVRGTRKEMGVIGQVAAGRFPERVDDLQARQRDLKYPAQVRRMGTRAHMAIRLPSEGRLLGVLEVGSKQRGGYTTDDLKLLRSLGNDIVAAIHNAQLHSELRDQLARVVPEKEQEIRLLEAQLAMHQAFAPGMDEESVLRLLLRETLALLRGPNFDVAGNVRSVDPQTMDAVLVSAESAFGPRAERIRKFRPADDPLTGGITRVGETLYLPDVNKDSRFQAEREQLTGLQREFYDRIRSLLVCPIRRGQQVGGQLALYRFDGMGFHDWQRDVVGRLCEQAGMALTNAAERRRANDSAELRQDLENVGARLAGLETRGQTLREAAQAARNLIGDEYAVLVCMLPILGKGDLVLEQIASSSSYQTMTKNVVRGAIKIPVTEALRAVLEGDQTRSDQIVEIDNPDDIRYHFLLEGTRRALLAPMRYRYGTILEGLIVAESPSGLPFGEWRREALRLIASQMAVHVARSRTLAEDYAAFVHHFRRPMSSLSGFLQRCDDLVEGGALPSDLAIITADAKATWEHFKAYDGAFGNLHDLDLQSHELREIVEDVVASASREAKERSITWRYQGRCESRRIRVDAAVTKGAILELINNAMDNDPAGNPIEVACEVADGQCLIRVRDRGRVITKEQYDHLFELRNPVGRPDDEPSGMGLWMVRTVMERQGGSIHLDKPDASPKAFVLTLPVFAEAKSDAAPVRESRASKPRHAAGSRRYSS